MRGVLANTSPIVAAQLALAVAALLQVSFAPPAQGRMLLVPITGKSITEPMIWGLHATPLKPGPLQGSWVVEGERVSLAGLLSSKGIIVLASPAALCGSRDNPS